MERSTSTLERVCGLSRQDGSRTSAFCVRGILSRYQSYLLVALQANEVVGFIRFAVQPIGPEAECPALYLNGVQLTEAKIHAFAVREDARGQGIGTELQRQTIRRAKDLGCYQVASYSSYGRDVNHHIKLSLGFAAQPEVHGNNHQGVYFIMPLLRR